MPSEFHDSFLRELTSGLRDLEARSQRRELAEIRGVNLCSNDYLGLAEHPALREAVGEAVRVTDRVGGTGSRLLSGHAAVWDELEEEFARFVGTESALYFGSGYAANIGLLTSVVTKDDLIFSDELNHASLVDGMRLSGARKFIYPHVDLYALELALREHQQASGRKFVVTETVFSMDGDVVDLRELAALCDRFAAGLILDEAHATGVHGPSGRGIAAEAGAVSGVLAATHTCGKALASAGAFVCGSAVLREHMINHARTLLFSTAMPPYMAGQIRAALRLAQAMDAQRADLLSRSLHFSAALRLQGWDTGRSISQVVPVIVGGNEEALAASEFLQREGFAVRAIRPPTVPVGRARLRLSISSSVAASELDRLEHCLASWRARECANAMAGRT